MATIFLVVYGKEGIRELALHNLAKADYAAKQFSTSRRSPAAVRRVLRASTSLCSRPQKRRSN